APLRLDLVGDPRAVLAHHDPAQALPAVVVVVRQRPLRGEGRGEQECERERGGRRTTDEHGASDNRGGHATSKSARRGRPCPGPRGHCATSPSQTWESN